jgi:2-methylcitrate dehydratase PrpD
MANETARLAEYAAGLRYEHLPPAVVQRAKDCIIDAVATITYGNTLPWSRIVVAYAEHVGAGGRCRILGSEGPAVQAPAAALANGALAHAFEMDTLTKPGTGCHPGASLLAPALAMAQDEPERAISGRDFIAAVVAGAEVLIRIGHATLHSNEKRGFHAPGTTGPFGAAVAAGHVLGFDAPTMANALGIAGSLSCGLLEFARSGTGAMVKRLHLGRAAESGVLAASLARGGFTGPVSVLEGKAGFLNVFCDTFNVAALTDGLASRYEMLSTLIKRYACHITAHTPVQALEELRAEHGFGPDDIDKITVAGIERMVRVNNIPVPTDRMMAQYSVPFVVALSMYRDARNPDSFDEDVVRDRAILDLCRRVELVVAEGKEPYGSLASTVTVRLRDGRLLTRRVEEFKGTPANPLDRRELKEKFLFLAGRQARAEELFERLQGLEDETDIRWIGAPPV